MITTPIDFTFIMNLTANWVNSLIDLFNHFVGSTVTSTLDLIIELNDKFPITELINIVLIPVRNIITNAGLGELTMLEFTLGFGFSIYLLFVFLRWLWNTLPLV